MSRPLRRAARRAPSALGRRVARLLRGPVPLSAVVVVTDDNAVLLGQCLASLEEAADVVLVATGTGADARRTTAAVADSRVRVVEAPDASYAVAANLGAGAVTQPHLVFVDAGDLVVSGSLRTMVATLKESGSDLAVAGQPPRATHRTLASAPDVLAGPALHDRVFRTSFWADGPGVAEGPLAGWLPAVEAHLRATAFDTVPAEVRRGLVRGTGEAFGSMPVLAPATGAFADAVDAVLKRLDGAALPDAAGALLEWLLDSELPRYLDDAERATPEQWDALAALARRLRDRAGTQVLMQRVGVESRVRLVLAADGRRDDLEEYAAARWHREGQYPTRVRNGEVSAVVDVSGVDSWLTLSPRETGLVCRLRAGRPAADGGVEIDVGAWITGVGFQHGAAQAAVTLVGPTGQRVPLPVTVHHEAELNQLLGERFQDHSGGLLRCHVGPGRLADPGPWRLEVTLTVAGVTRSADVSLELPARWGVGSGARLLEARLEDGELVLEVAGSPPGVVELRGPAASVESAGAGGSCRIPLQHNPWGLGPVPLPTGGYRLRLVGGASSGPLLVGDTLAPRLPQTHRSPLYRLGLRRAANGEAVVDLRPPLADDELGPFAQERLQRWYASDEHRLDPRAVLLQSYTGQAATDSPRAIHEALRRMRPDLRLTWAVADRSTQVPEGAASVVVRTRQWYDALARSGFVVTNIDLDWWFVKRPGQRVLQTFHGYPSKTMGLSAWQAKSFTPRRVERLLRRTSGTWDLLLTPSPAMDVHYREQYRYDGPILSQGYPRDDVLVGPDADALRAAARTRLGLDEAQTAVLYAPTWRDDLATDHRAAPMITGLDVGRLARALGADHTILLRGHRFHRNRPGFDATRVVDCTDYPEVNDLVLAADAAVFDYSSMRFDFALTGRPMVFHVPDLDRYVGKVRGFLYDFTDTAPGPLVSTTDEVADALRDVDGIRTAYADAYRRLNDTYNGEQDGHAAERVVRAFFD